MKLRDNSHRNRWSFLFWELLHQTKGSHILLAHTLAATTFDLFPVMCVLPHCASLDPREPRAGPLEVPGPSFWKLQDTPTPSSLQLLCILPSCSLESEPPGFPLYCNHGTDRRKHNFVSSLYLEELNATRRRFSGWMLRSLTRRGWNEKTRKKVFMKTNNSGENRFVLLCMLFNQHKTTQCDEISSV